MSSHSDAKTIVALVPHNPSYNHMKIKERGKNRGHRLARVWQQCEWEWLGHEKGQIGGWGFWNYERNWENRVRDLREMRNESKAPGGCNKGVRVWTRSKHNLKGPSARAAVPPGGRSRAARRYTSKMPLDLFFWCGARRALGSRQAASS